MSAEIVDIFDEHGQNLGSMSRVEAEAKGHIIENVIVFVFNSLGKVWVQKRPMHKATMKGLWDTSVSGAVKSGEKPPQAAVREQQEEMGFTSDLHLIESFENTFDDENGSKTTRRSHLFIAIDDRIPQPNEEVDEHRSEYPDVLRSQVITDPREYVPSMLFELDKAIAGFKAFFHE